MSTSSNDAFVEHQQAIQDIKDKWQELNIRRIKSNDYAIADCNKLLIQAKRLLAIEENELVTNCHQLESKSWLSLEDIIDDLEKAVE